MDTSDGLEFVNRGDELHFLKECLIQAHNRPALVIIRSPSGFGKSTLTDHLSKIDSLSSPAFCIVDPSIRGRTGAVLVYDGFFLQKVAEAIDRLASSKKYSWPTLSEFLKDRKKKSLATKNANDILSELPSLKHAYKIIYDYTARAFSFGRYAPEKLLVSDESDAIAICSAYAKYCLESYSFTMVLREAQHIDLHSLKSLLLLSESHPGPNLIIEYTSENSCFEPEHQKLILRTAGKSDEVKLLDLVRLNEAHLEYLIRNNVRNDFNLTSDYYLSWDGNLRSIIELKFQVGIGQSLIDGTKISKTLANLTDTVVDHISRLTPLEKILLAMVLSHVESIDLSTISSVIYRINSHESQSAISKALDSLEDKHSFLSRSAGAVSIRNDTIAKSLYKSHSMQGLVAVSEKALREHYAEALKGNLGGTSLFNSVRQYFRLCARTKDIQGLSWSIKYLSKAIKSTQDQSIYIDVISSAIQADPELYKGDYEELLDWGAELAYAASDWNRAASLLSLKGEHTPYSKLMYACTLQEIGRHNEALAMIETLSEAPKNTDVFITKLLVESMIIGGEGQYDKARNILNSITNNEGGYSGPLIGYAYRFFEIVDGLESSLENLIRSIDWFEKHGLLKSKAYSQLASAMLLARSGKIIEARHTLDEASSMLSDEVRDQYLILNNTGAVELLTDKPDFSLCCEILSQALKFACDDFSELTILINLGLSYLGTGNFSEASNCADKCWAILNNHDFADTNIYWPACFNMSVVYSSVGNSDKAKTILKLPFEEIGLRTDDSEYWEYRYGMSSTIPESHRFLATKEWHPVYLSHWLIDLEGLALLKVAIR